MLGAAEDEPRPAGATGAARLHPPAAGHPQVAAEHEPALETEQEILPHRVDRLEPMPVQTLHQPLPARPRVRRLHLDGLADEHLETLCGAMERIALWHSESLRLRT